MVGGPTSSKSILDEIRTAIEIVRIALRSNHTSIPELSRKVNGTLMVEISDSLQCLFSASVTERNGSYVVEIPRREIESGNISQDELYRVGLLAHEATSQPTGESPGSSQRAESPQRQGPPVEEGEIIEVEIETLGDQGDGIAKVDHGYVVIVDGGHPGDTLAVEIDTVRESVAFADVISNDS
jgi:predicted RNA-binding protein with TRAM domain